MAYQDQIKENLSQYRSDCLGVRETGIWTRNGRHYDHILPEAQRRLNIIEPYKDRFWDFIQNHPEIKLHQDFHHLNSSQAMCFNLFYPFMAENRLDLLWQLLALSDADKPVTSIFEHIPESGRGNENSNIDFWVETGSTCRIVMELKLSEAEFGRAGHHQSAIERLARLYRPILGPKIAPQYLEEKFFIDHYQILRNFYYVRPTTTDHLFFIFPRANQSLQRKVETINEIARSSLVKQTDVFYLEDLVHRFLSCPVLTSDMKRHYDEFQKKYII